MTRRQLLITLPAALRAAAQDQDEPVFRVNTNSVGVHVAVLDSNKAVAGLTREDFVLRDNGEARPITSFTHEEQPLDIVLVCRSVMVGRAMPSFEGGIPQYHLAGRGPVAMAIRLMNAAANAILPARDTDRVAMVVYGRDPHIVQRFTNNRKDMASAIRRIGSVDEVDENLVITSEALAIEYAVQMLADLEKQEPDSRLNRRRVIIMISNPFGVGARYADEPIIRKLWERNIVFSAIKDSEAVKESPSLLPLFREFNPSHIARATGGDYIPVLDPRNPPDLLMLARQRYTLWFNQPQDLPAGQLRTISVSLAEESARRVPNAKITAREGYITQ